MDPEPIITPAVQNTQTLNMYEKNPNYKVNPFLRNGANVVHSMYTVMVKADKK